MRGDHFIFRNWYICGPKSQIPGFAILTNPGISLILLGTRSGYHLLGVTLINISINFFHIKKLPPKLPPFLFGTQRAWVSCFGQVVVIHMPPRPDTGQKYFLGVQLNGVYGSTSF